MCVWEKISNPVGHVARWWAGGRKAHGPAVGTIFMYAHLVHYVGKITGCDKRIDQWRESHSKRADHEDEELPRSAYPSAVLVLRLD